MDAKLAMRQPCALVAKTTTSLLGCIRQSIASRFRGDSLPLLSPGETQLECWVQSWAPQSKRDRDILEEVHKRATKMITGLEHSMHGG